MGCMTSTSSTGWESPVRGQGIEAVAVGYYAEEKPQKLHMKNVLNDRLGEGTVAFAREPTSHKTPRMRKDFQQHYILKDKLGKGAHAPVHLATALADGKEVAVKVIDLVQVKASVANEIAILKRVSTLPHCVPFPDVYREGAVFYLVMEKCDMTLLQALESIPELTEHLVVPFVVEMLQALDSIHALSPGAVVHRDIKPANFLCTGKDCTVKLCDFGTAQLLPDRSSKLRGVDGTPAFMSPEMLQLHDYGTETDVWSLGVTVYLLTCGQFPYQPRHPTSHAMKHAISAGTPKPTFQPAASQGVMRGAPLSRPALDFLRALLERNPVARPTAADALLLPWMTDSQAHGQ